MIELLKEMDYLHSRIKSNVSTPTKKRYGEQMITILKEHTDICEFWEYRPNEFLWARRFAKIKTYYESNTVKIIKGIVHDPVTNLLAAPSYKGIYLIGQVTCNPYTDDKQYWVKVGYSHNIQQRFASGYATHSPCTALIATSESTKEVHCHNILRSIALGRCQQNTEWWLVDKETYLQICEQKFEFFGL